MKAITINTNAVTTDSERVAISKALHAAGFKDFELTFVANADKISVECKSFNGSKRKQAREIVEQALCGEAIERGKKVVAEAAAVLSKPLFQAYNHNGVALSTTGFATRKQAEAEARKYSQATGNGASVSEIGSKSALVIAPKNEQVEQTAKSSSKKSEPKEREVTLTAYLRELIVATESKAVEMTNAEIAEEIKQHFPDSAISGQYVAKSRYTVRKLLA